MYNNYHSYPPHYYNASLYDPYALYGQTPHHDYNKAPGKTPACFPPPDECFINLKDYGPEPFVINIEKATEYNNNFRTALWTGEYLQLTLMSINVGDDIGLEMHSDHDQFIRIEQGQGMVVMGDCRHNLNFERNIFDDYVVFIPAGKWHNIINTGCVPLKLYSIYAPPEHPHGTVHRTKEEAEMGHHPY